MDTERDQTDQPAHDEDRVDPTSLWQYEGRLYIRPTGRGVCLGDHDMEHMDETLAEVFNLTLGMGGWTPRVRITIEQLEDE